VDPLVSTLILILVALLGARFSFSTEGAPLGPRLLFRTGTHFVFVGVRLGPEVLGLVSAEALAQLDPLLALALGWVGFLFGLQLDRESLGQFPLKFFLVAGLQAVLTFALFFSLGWALLEAVGQADEIQMLLLGGAAATACTTTPAGIAMVSTNFLVRGRVRELLFFIASVDALVGLTGLQIVYSLYHPAQLLQGLASVPPAGWTLLALGIAILCAILFLWLTRARPGSEELVLILLGISALVAGAALQLQVSPLFVSAVMGVVVANLHADRQRIFSVLHDWEKPIYVVLLILAGALLRFPTIWILPLVAFYVVARTLGKVVGSAGALSITTLRFPVPRRLGLGLIPQGGISLAMAVSMVLTYEGLAVGGYSAADLFFAVVVGGVVVSELTGPFFVTQVLRRAGEISPSVEQALEEGDDRKAKEEAIRHAVPGDAGAAGRNGGAEGDRGSEASEGSGSSGPTEAGPPDSDAGTKENTGAGE